MAWVMADGEESTRWKISTNTVYNTLKTDTKYSHSVRSRPTLKDNECFWNGFVRKPYERSLYERTLMSEPGFHRETTELPNVNWEKHKLLKSHRVCRRNRESSRIQTWSYKSLTRKVREFVYAPCHLHCTVMQMLKIYLGKRSLTSLMDQHNIVRMISFWKRGAGAHLFCWCLYMFRNEYLVSGV